MIGKSFKVNYAKKNYIIDDILIDRNPNEQDFTYENKTVTLKEYYKKKYDKTIKDLNQPLWVVKRKDAQEEDINLFFVPELCNLAGLTDELVKGRDFMKKLADFRKLTPQDRIKKTNEFLNLLVETVAKDDQVNKGKKLLSLKTKIWSLWYWSKSLR